MKKLLAGLLAVTMLFALTACGGKDGGNSGGKAAKNMTEVSAKVGWDRGKITMSVPKNDDGTPKFDFTETAPEGLQEFYADDAELFLATDKATFTFSVDQMVYNTSIYYKEKYGEQPASFEKYLEWLDNDEDGQKTKSNLEVLEVGGRKATRYSAKEGSPSDYDYYGYMYSIAYDDIEEGKELNVYVVYPNSASEKEAKELDQEVLDMLNSIKLEKAE